MRRYLDRLFDTSGYTNPTERERASIVYSLSAAILVLTIIFTLFNQDEAGRTIWQQIADNPLAPLPSILGILAALAGWALVRVRRASAASLFTLLALAGAIGVPAVESGFYSATYGFGFGMVLVLSVLLLRYSGLALGLALALGTTALGIMNRATVSPPQEFSSTTSFLNAFVLLVGIAVASYLLLRYANRSRIEGAKAAMDERLRLAEITSLIAQRISRRMALQDVLNSAVEQIRLEYPLIYHAQIFLIEGQDARLVASTGEVGRLLMERQHRLPVGSLSVIGQVTASSRPLISRAGAGETIHRRNEFLPETAVEAAFPLRVGDAVIGALDLQSKVVVAFQDEDIPIFQSLADHLAVAIDNARLFEDSERRAEENRLLAEQTRRSAEEVARLNQQLIGRFWADFLAQRPDAVGLALDFAANTAAPEAPWTPTLQEAVAANAPVHRQDDGAQVVAVPLRVRGQVIGAMEFELDETGSLTPEDIKLIQEAGERLGLAAETSRLFEASQTAAHREALVNEIATRLQASNTVEATLNAAARSLKETLKASRVSIRLGTPPATKSRVVQGNGS